MNATNAEVLETLAAKWIARSPETAHARIMRGLQLAKTCAVTTISPVSFVVIGKTGLYTVEVGTDGVARCSCPDHIHRGVKCAHVWACAFTAKLRARREAPAAAKPSTRETLPVAGPPSLNSGTYSAAHAVGTAPAPRVAPRTTVPVPPQAGCSIEIPRAPRLPTGLVAEVA